MLRQRTPAARRWRAFAGQPAPAVTAGLLQQVRAFAGSAPQSDDIAILVLRTMARPVGA